MLLIAAPGQGAQAPGFLAAWLELPGFADRLAAWSDLAGCDLIRCGTTADAEEIRDTAIAQPLLVAAAVAAAAELLGGADQADELADAALAAGVGATAGHSVGELAAGAIAGVLSAEDAIRLVRVRGQAMAQAAAAEPTGMTAVLGGDEQDVLAAIEEHGLTPANVNGAGQIVAAGTLDRAGRVRRRPAAACQAPAALGGRRVPHPATWRRPSTRCAPRPTAWPCAARRSRCCRTATAPWCVAAATGSSGSSRR